MPGMTADSFARRRPGRAGAVAALVMTVFGAGFTLLLLAVAIWWAAAFAADDELHGSAWITVGGLATYALASAAATWFIGRRGMRELRRVRGR